MTKTLFETERNKVVAFYVAGKLMWTTTYTFDAEGYVEDKVRVMRDGSVIKEVQ